MIHTEKNRQFVSQFDSTRENTKVIYIVLDKGIESSKICGFIETAH
jgi:hypothetical protein